MEKDRTGIVTVEKLIAMGAGEVPLMPFLRLVFNGLNRPNQEMSYKHVAREIENFCKCGLKECISVKWIDDHFADPEPPKPKGCGCAGLDGMRKEGRVTQFTNSRDDTKTSTFLQFGKERVWVIRFCPFCGAKLEE